MFLKRDLININKNHMMHFLKQIDYLVPLDIILDESIYTTYFDKKAPPVFL